MNQQRIENWKKTSLYQNYCEDREASQRQRAIKDVDVNRLINRLRIRQSIPEKDVLVIYRDFVSSINTDEQLIEVSKRERERNREKKERKREREERTEKKILYVNFFFFFFGTSFFLISQRTKEDSIQLQFHFSTHLSKSGRQQLNCLTELTS